MNKFKSKIKSTLEDLNIRYEELEDGKGFGFDIFDADDEKELYPAILYPYEIYPDTFNIKVLFLISPLIKNNDKLADSHVLLQELLYLNGIIYPSTKLTTLLNSLDLTITFDIPIEHFNTDSLDLAIYDLLTNIRIVLLWLINESKQLIELNDELRSSKFYSSSKATTK